MRYTLSCLFLLLPLLPKAQVPTFQFEGFMEIIMPYDTTSIYVGKNAGHFQDTVYGHSNSFFGTNTGALNLDGSQNSFFGRDAGKRNWSGTRNSFFGVRSGAENFDGHYNSFFGLESGRDNSDGQHNSFFGVGAGSFNNYGNSNSFFGSGAGVWNATGNNNTAIGYHADFYYNNLNFATAIGAQSVVSTDNTIVVGREADTTAVPGRLMIGSTVPEFYDTQVVALAKGSNFPTLAIESDDGTDPKLQLVYQPEDAESDWTMRMDVSFGEELQWRRNNAVVMRLSTIGNLDIVGNLSKGSGTFKIDHPLDPLNKYLSHSFVESPDMMNVYNGNIITDVGGYAVVQLPEYFEALNRDFRYQLTVIGDFAQAIVARKIENNHFTIRTDKPRIEVSWQVTGIRDDAFARMNPVIVEVEKKEMKGTYLHPDAFGLNNDSEGPKGQSKVSRVKKQ